MKELLFWLVSPVVLFWKLIDITVGSLIDAFLGR